MPSLRILGGPDAGMLIPLEGERITIGRNPDCGVVIPLTSVCRVHAQILKVGEDYHIEDAKSRGGTYVNNQVIRTPTTLKNKDRIRICNFIAVFLDQTDAATKEDSHQRSGDGS